MLKGKLRNTFIALLLLTYIGQGLVAAGMPCNSMGLQAVQVDKAATAGGCSGHSEHASIDSGNNANTPDGCPHCNCFMGGCSAFALVSVAQALVQPRLSVLVDGHLGSTSIHLPPSLFRPPIAA